MRVESTAMTTKLFSGMQNGRDFAVEWRETALVIADSLLIDPNMGAIVGCANVQKGTHIGLWLIREITLVPEDAFVAKQRWVLGIPVSGNLEGGGASEVIFLHSVFAHQCRMLIEPIAVIAHRTVGVVKTSSGHVHEVVPLAIEAGSGTVVDIHKKGLQWLLREGGRYVKEAKEHYPTDRARFAG